MSSTVYISTTLFCASISSCIHVSVRDAAILVGGCHPKPEPVLPTTTREIYRPVRLSFADLWNQLIGHATLGTYNRGIHTGTYACTPYIAIQAYSVI